jgi:hypothetical protein
MKQLGCHPKTIHVSRTAGSHGPYDVMWIRNDGIRLYQVKYGQFPAMGELDFAVLEQLGTVCPVFVFWKPRGGQAVMIPANADDYQVAKEAAAVAAKTSALSRVQRPEKRKR